jgi:hypothetical protein
MEPKRNGGRGQQAMTASPDLERYKTEVGAALRTILGDSGAKAILFYLGEFDPQTFESKIRSILGNGATIVIQELKRRLDAEGIPHKHHWLGRNTQALQRLGGGVAGLCPSPLSFFLSLATG